MVKFNNGKSIYMNNAVFGTKINNLKEKFIKAKCLLGFYFFSLSKLLFKNNKPVFSSTGSYTQPSNPSQITISAQGSNGKASVITLPAAGGNSGNGSVININSNNTITISPGASGCVLVSGGAGGGGGGGGNGGGSGGQIFGGAGGMSWQPMNSTWNMDGPLISLSKIDDSTVLEKTVEERKWSVVNLTFQDLISLQESGIKYKWTQENDIVYITFETDYDENHATLLLNANLSNIDEDQ